MRIGVGPIRNGRSAEAGPRSGTPWYEHLFYNPWEMSIPTIALLTIASAARPVTVAVIAAFATVTVAIIGALAAYLSAKRDRRRRLYGEAVRAAMAWQELLYRVRRRGEDEGRALVHRFHTAQDQLSYYQAWVASDSKYMARSYERLVREVKTATEALIREAWDSPVREIPGNARPGDSHPDLRHAQWRFMADVRSHLSPFPWRRVAVAVRNRDVDDGG